MSGFFAAYPSNLKARHRVGRVNQALLLGSTLAGVVLLAALLLTVVVDAWGYVDWAFLTSPASRDPDKAGIRVAILGSAWLAYLTALFALPVGIGAAIYLEEYRRPGRLGDFIEVNIANLAGVPSIVYGMLGLAVFVRGIVTIAGEKVAFGRTVISGALTMSLLVLPMVITASREALRAVPGSIRLAAFAVGATRWQTVRHHVLPQALPGILTGVILALSRAVGETAPLIMIGAFTYLRFAPAGPMDEFTALPIQIFNWASRPQPGFHGRAAAAILVLLVMLFALNSAAVYIRYRTQKGRL